MTFDEALLEMDNGHFVKLPEWVGYWFAHNKIILVMTKEGNIEKTPWIFEYYGRTDWEIYRP